MCQRSSAERLWPEACSTLQWNSTQVPARPVTATGSGELFRISIMRCLGIAQNLYEVDSS